MVVALPANVPNLSFHREVVIKNSTQVDNRVRWRDGDTTNEEGWGRDVLPLGRRGHVHINRLGMTDFLTIRDEPVAHLLDALSHDSNGIELIATD